MLNTNLLVQKYGEESEKKFITIRDELTLSNADKKLLLDAEEIVKTLVDLKLDIDSVCAGFAYPFILRDNNLKSVLKDYSAIGKIVDSLLVVDLHSKDYTDPDFVIENGELLECVDESGDVYIPYGVTDMYQAFRFCEKLKNVTDIPDSVTNMVGTFRGCKGRWSPSFNRSDDFCG